MNIVVAIPVAATWGWGIGMGICMLVMGMMMFAMMGRGHRRGGRPRSWSGGWPGSRSETPSAVLERRFAEGEISAEEYRERRAILADETVTQNDGHRDDALTAPGPREGRQ